MVINKINVSELTANVRQNPILWDSRIDGYKMAEWKPAIWAQIVENLKADRCVCSSLKFMWLLVLEATTAVKQSVAIFMKCINYAN